MGSINKKKVGDCKQESLLVVVHEIITHQLLLPLQLPQDTLARVSVPATDETSELLVSFMISSPLCVSDNCIYHILPTHN